MARGGVKPRPSKDGKRMTYRIKWETRGPDGKRQYHSATRRTKAEADKRLAEKLKEVNDGTHVTPSNETVGEYLSRWLDATKTSRSDSTDHVYRSIVRNRLAPLPVPASQSSRCTACGTPWLPCSSPQVSIPRLYRNGSATA